MKPDNPQYRVPIAVDLLNFKKEDLELPYGLKDAKVLYHIKSVGDFKAFKNRKDFLDRHRTADIWLTTNDGTPLMAIYKSPFCETEDAAFALFKTLRQQRYNDDEYDDETDVKKEREWWVRQSGL